MAKSVRSARFFLSVMLSVVLSFSMVPSAFATEAEKMAAVLDRDFAKKTSGPTV